MGRGRRQIAWGLLDQGLSSATNFGGSVLAARVLSTEDFGAFAVVFSLYLVALGLSRSWTSEPLIVRFAAETDAEQHVATRQAATTSISAGLVAGSFLAVAGG